MKHDWEYKKLGDCFSYIKNGANIKQDKSRIGYPITRIETLSNGVFNRDKMGYAGITELGKYKANVLEDKDLLMSHINSKTYVGRTVVYDKQGDEKIIHGMNLLRLIPCNFIISSYFQYHTQSSYFKNCIARIRKDAVNQSSFAIGDLIRIPIPVPPLPIQQQIVDELDKLSEIIEKKKQQVKELDTLAQAIFYDMFGDPVENEKGWEVKKLGDCGMVSSGGTPSRTKPHYFTGKINWYSAGELNKLYLSESVEKITEEAIAESSAKLFPANSLFIGMYDTAAFKLGITRESASSNQACANFFSESMHLVYLYYLLLFIKHKVLNDRHGARQKNLSVGYIKGLKLPIAPLPLQQSFAQKIEAIEKQKELINQSIKETQTLFDSRMDYYFGE